jgi:hypothetical protein
MPTKLYRCFKCREYADQFLAGDVRFGILEYYKTLEEVGRGDPTEGRGLHIEYRRDRKAVRISGGVAKELASPGPVTVHSECGNPLYVYCLTLPPDAVAWARVRQDFGEIVVEIDDAERLRADVAVAVNPGDPWQRNAAVALWPAQYKRGQELSPTTDAELMKDPVKRAATMKPPSYGYQHEHRLILISHGLWQVNGDAPQFLTVRLPKPPTYARMVGK